MFFDCTASYIVPVFSKSHSFCIVVFEAKKKTIITFCIEIELIKSIVTSLLYNNI